MSMSNMMRRLPRYCLPHRAPKGPACSSVRCMLQSTSPVSRRSSAAALRASTFRAMPRSRNMRYGLASTGVRQLTGQVKSAEARKVLMQLMTQIGSKKEVDQYLKHYATIDSKKFAVIKVGGGVLVEEMDVLVESLQFLHSVGLTPVVIHGAGPQLNAELKEQGIVSDYINGKRVTTPTILNTARKVFLRENLKLVNALEDKGVDARPIVTGVFTAELEDKETLQLVGKIMKVDAWQVYDAIDMGYVPILTCMGEAYDGQILNVNADIAAVELARAIQPHKVVYISSVGGLRDERDELIRVIDLHEDYDHLMEQPWFRHGNRLKLKEIKELLQSLPPSSSVAITSAANLPKELFTHKGEGTLVRRTDRIYAYDDLNEVDIEGLTRLIEDSFERKLPEGYIEKLKPKVSKLLLAEDYRACALVTHVDVGGESIPYLDKFAVSKAFQNDGAAGRLMRRLKTLFPKLFWRSRMDNVNKHLHPWYFEKVDGTYTDGTWRVFWYGFTPEQALPCIEQALARPVSFLPNPTPAPQSLSDAPVENARAYSTMSLAASGRKTVTGAGIYARRTLPGSSVFLRPRKFGGRYYTTHGYLRSASNAIDTSGSIKVGLIGARGHTGNELLRILDRHSQLTLGVASSRALKGERVGSAVDGLSKDCKFADLKFVDLEPEQLADHKDVQVWVLAMPNKLAAPFVEAMDTFPRDNIIVDLSADYRFNDSWTYGLPERKLARSFIKQAIRVANPGCYATGAQLSILPLTETSFLEPSHSPHIFGVSGYSGAGTTPSRKNDLNELKDNFMPYTQQGHIHEREVSYQLSTQVPAGVRFMPHVAPWFRGISLTVAMQLSSKSDLTREDIVRLYQGYYRTEPLVKVMDDIPEVRQVQGQHHVNIGGFTYDAKTKRLVVNTVIDNLLKGAATQCVQNLNLMLGLNEYDGMGLTNQ